MSNEVIDGLFFLYLESIKKDSSKRDPEIEELYANKSENNNES